MELYALAAEIAVLAMLLVAGIARAWVRTHLTPERLAHVMDVARNAVRAAEQIGEDLGELLDAAGVGTKGAAKLDFAATVVAQSARRLGLRLKEDEVQSAVHAALREMHEIDAALAADDGAQLAA